MDQFTISSACALSAILGALVILGPAQHSTTASLQPGEGVHGIKIVVPAVATRSWADLVQSEADRIGPPEPFVNHAPLPSGRDGRELGPDGNIGDHAPPSELGEAAPNAGFESPWIPSIRSSFQALNDPNFVIPPDTMGAVGPNHVMVMLNDRVRIQNRAGGIVSTVSLFTFWAPAAPSSPFDPTVIYDELSDRWIACVDSHRSSINSRVLFAISSTSDPTGAWSYYRLDADPGNTVWADFPRAGYNSTWIAITNNMFTIENSDFTGVSMWVIDKAAALVPGGPVTVTAFYDGFDEDPVFHTSGFTMVPATTHDAAEPALWIIDRDGIVSNGVQAHRLSSITGTGPAPVWSRAAGGAFPDTGLYLVTRNYSPVAPDAFQLGTTIRLETNDPRILDAEFRNGRLWYTHVGGMPSNGPTRTSTFWYETNPYAPLATSIVQSGVIDSTTLNHFFPSIAVNFTNDVMLGFTRCGLSIYAEAAFAFRLANDAPGTMRPVQQIKAGEDSYVKSFGSGRYRWGDYSATVVDPLDDRSMWTLQEYAALDVGPADNDDRWGTWWGKLAFPSPCPADIDGDGVVNAADFNILANSFGREVTPNTGGDLNGDGLVNVADFILLAGGFGCGPG